MLISCAIGTDKTIAVCCRVVLFVIILGPLGRLITYVIIKAVYTNYKLLKSNDND